MRPTDEEIRAKREESRARKTETQRLAKEAHKALLPTGVEFHEWPKVARLRRETVITEKIDGTNAAVGVTEDGRVYAQSRKQLITPVADNHGFARWVAEHADGLADELGPGLHFGEWWGKGVQRGYGLDEKRFSLFNVLRWQDAPLQLCSTVPVLVHMDTFSDALVYATLDVLRESGSAAAPGFMDPEGIVLYHKASNTLFKQTLDDDDTGKEYGS
jgi:hypothetical protein